MKSTGRCPKCGNDDIIIIDGYCGVHGSGNNIIIGMSYFSAVPVDRYICASCGFSEEWIREEDIEKCRHTAHTRYQPR